MMNAGSMNCWPMTSMGIYATVGAGMFLLLGLVHWVAGQHTYAALLLGEGVALLSGCSSAKLAAP